MSTRACARARAWVETELHPHADESEAAGSFPDDVFRRLAAAGPRELRDARLGPIGGGTDEIMREIVGRGFGL